MMEEKIVRRVEELQEQFSALEQGERCNKCDQKIEGESLEVGGSVYHADCFTCDHCKERLSGQFYRVGDQNFCERDRELSLQACSACGDLMRSGSVEVGGSLYHQDCFCCSLCSAPILDKFYTSPDGSWLCETDFRDSQPRCGVCSLPIMERVLTAMDKKFHPSCFRCYICDMCLDGEAFMVEQDQVNCIQCYAEHKAQICHRCEEPIVARPGRRTTQVTCKNRTYHGACYTCLICKKDLGGQKAFLDSSDEVMCAQCGGSDAKKI